jgi:hypothetical protein
VVGSDLIFHEKVTGVRADRKDLLTFDFDEVVADSEVLENTVLVEIIPASTARSFSRTLWIAP